MKNQVNQLDKDNGIADERKPANVGFTVLGERVSRDGQVFPATLCRVFENVDDEGNVSLALSHRDNRLPADSNQYTAIRFLEKDGHNLIGFAKYLERKGEEMVAKYSVREGQ